MTRLDGCVECDSPLTKEFRMDMARLEIPVSGCTCLRTGRWDVSRRVFWTKRCDGCRTLVDVGGVGLLAGLGALLLVTGRGGGLLACLLLLGRSLASWCLAGGGGSLLKWKSANARLLVMIAYDCADGRMGLETHLSCLGSHFC